MIYYVNVLRGFDDIEVSCVVKSSMTNSYIGTQFYLLPGQRSTGFRSNGDYPTKKAADIALCGYALGEPKLGEVHSFGEEVR